MGFLGVRDFGFEMLVLSYRSTHIECKALTNRNECGKCSVAREEYVIQLHRIQTTWESFGVFFLQVTNKIVVDKKM